MLYQGASFLTAVSEVPVTFVVPLKPQSVSENQSVTLECETSKPNQKVTWLKAGREVKPNRDVEITAKKTVHRLTIKSAGKEDAVEYSAKLPTDKTSAKLTVRGSVVTSFLQFRIVFFLAMLVGVTQCKDCGGLCAFLVESVQCRF